MEIPISFEYKGKEFKGTLSDVMGAGDTLVFYLNDDRNYYCGRLRRHNNEWVFDANRRDPQFKELADFFGDHITAWLE